MGKQLHDILRSINSSTTTSYSKRRLLMYSWIFSWLYGDRADADETVYTEEPTISDNRIENEWTWVEAITDESSKHKTLHLIQTSRTIEDKGNTIEEVLQQKYSKLPRRIYEKSLGGGKIRPVKQRRHARRLSPICTEQQLVRCCRNLTISRRLSNLTDNLDELITIKLLEYKPVVKYIMEMDISTTNDTIGYDLQAFLIRLVKIYKRHQQKRQRKNVQKEMLMIEWEPLDTPRCESTKKRSLPLAQPSSSRKVRYYDQIPAWTIDGSIYDHAPPACKVAHDDIIPSWTIDCNNYCHMPSWMRNIDIFERPEYKRSVRTHKGQFTQNANMDTSHNTNTLLCLSNKESEFIWGKPADTSAILTPLETTYFIPEWIQRIDSSIFWDTPQSGQAVADQVDNRRKQTKAFDENDCQDDGHTSELIKNVLLSWYDDFEKSSGHQPYSREEHESFIDSLYDPNIVMENGATPLNDSDELAFWFDTDHNDLDVQSNQDVKHEDLSTCCKTGEVFRPIPRAMDKPRRKRTKGNQQRLAKSETVITLKKRYMTESKKYVRISTKSRKNAFDNSRRGKK